MSFAVVRFIDDDTFSEVPTSWLCNSNQQCWWPTSKNTTALMMKGVYPDPNTWELFHIEFIGFYPTLESARKRAALNSDYASTNEDQGRGKRLKKKKPHHDNCDSDEQFSDEDDITPPPTLKKNRKLSQPTHSILDSILNAEIIIEDNLLEVEGSQHNPSNQFHTLIQEPETTRRNANETNCKDDNILSICKTVLVYVKSIDERLKKLEGTNKETDDEFTETINELLPVDTLQEIRKLENDIRENKQLKTKFVSYLKKIGGRSAKEYVSRILQKIYTNKVALSCSWLGHRNNFRIKDLIVTNAVKDAVLTSFNSVSENDIEIYISEWFRLSKMRYTREMQQIPRHD